MDHNLISDRGYAPPTSAKSFPFSASANVDTRVIAIARADHEGLQQSTPAERATIAELWINRDWNLYAKWMATPWT